MSRKPLSAEAEAELNAVLRRAAERMEQRKRPEEQKALKGVLAALDEQPREA
jgi:TPP-dependent pyruvate/acetoin dehydrogenase alpha subunit